MLDFFKAGGFPMWFVLAFGAAALASAVMSAWRRDLQRIEMVRAWTWATVFSVLAGVAADVGAVGAQVPKHPEWTAGGKYADVVLTGIAESMSPPILGFTLLSLAWMVVAIAHRRARALE